MTHKEYLERRDEILEKYFDVQTNRASSVTEVYENEAEIQKAIDQLVLDVIGEDESIDPLIAKHITGDMDKKLWEKHMLHKNFLRKAQRQIVQGDSNGS